MPVHVPINCFFYRRRSAGDGGWCSLSSKPSLTFIAGSFRCAEDPSVIGLTVRYRQISRHNSLRRRNVVRCSLFSQIIDGLVCYASSHPSQLSLTVIIFLTQLSLQYLTQVGFG